MQNLPFTIAKNDALCYNILGTSVISAESRVPRLKYAENPTKARNFIMYTDIHGVRRLKINLHTHTTVSDGEKTPAECAAVYRAAGYDAIALTDHWVFTPAGEIDGLPIISGCEYNVSGPDREGGVYEVYHVVAIGCTAAPCVPREWERMETPGVRDRVRAIIDAIHAVGGLAVLAHPAWSLNTPEQMLSVAGYDATEIYNSVSDWGMSDRPYSGLLVDEAAMAGVTVPLLATDDTHYYDGDQCRGFVMVEADAVEEFGLMEAIRRERFYASNAPEIHLERVSEREVRLSCSPAVKIAFLSNGVWTAGRMVRGEALTEATYVIKPHETFLRAEVTDRMGRMAYSNILRLRED